MMVEPGAKVRPRRGIFKNKIGTAFGSMGDGRIYVYFGENMVGKFKPQNLEVIDDATQKTGSNGKA